jgi:hypothetical protein
MCYDVFWNKTNYEIVYLIYEEDGYFIVVILAVTRESLNKELKRHLLKSEQGQIAFIP